jgi:hypothetical protein
MVLRIVCIKKKEETNIEIKPIHNIECIHLILKKWNLLEKKKRNKALIKIDDFSPGCCSGL